MRVINGALQSGELMVLISDLRSMVVTKKSHVITIEFILKYKQLCCNL